MARNTYLQIYSNCSNPKNSLISSDLCFGIDLQLVASLFQIEIAIHRALLNEQRCNMKMKTFESEVKYYLSPSKKSLDSMRYFDVNNSSPHIAVVYFNKEYISELNSRTEGTLVDPSNFQFIPDDQKLRAIISHYDLSEQELAIGSLEDAVLMKIVAKHL